MKRNPATSKPTPVLQPDTIYAADNGALICLRCAGMTAKYAGMTLDGDRVLRLSSNGRAAFEWYQEFGKPLTCEAGCTTYPVPIPEAERPHPDRPMCPAFA